MRVSCLKKNEFKEIPKHIQKIYTLQIYFSSQSVLQTDNVHPDSCVQTVKDARI